MSLHDLGEKEKNIKVKVIDVSSLTDAQQDKIAAEIRTIAPQTRGRVVSGGGMTLALSGKKNLNLDNTPILLVKDSLDRPLSVFPHALEGKVETVQDHLNNALERGTDAALHEKRVPTEELLTELLSVVPSIVEEGLTVLGKEYSTATGAIDLLMLDRSDTPVVVEVEVTATEQAVGQVCKLAEGYVQSLRRQESDNATKQGNDVKIRKAIVCIKTKGMINRACKSAGVELYQLGTERIT
jgi:Holliday junction resolvase-like predicted endonuclease